MRPLRKLRHSRALIIIPALLALSACKTDPEWANKEALKIGAPLADAVQVRERQTETFSVTSEAQLLSETTQVLQDLGFTIEESSARYGVLEGSKNRDATEAGQVAGQIALTVGLALMGYHYTPSWDKDQVIRATVTTYPAGQHEVRMRISFERIVTDTQRLSRVEELTAPEFSKGFFNKIRSGLAQDHTS